MSSPTASQSAPESAPARFEPPTQVLSVEKAEEILEALWELEEPVEGPNDIPHHLRYGFEVWGNWDGMWRMPMETTPAALYWTWVGYFALPFEVWRPHRVLDHNPRFTVMFMEGAPVNKWENSIWGAILNVYMVHGAEFSLCGHCCTNCKQAGNDKCYRTESGGKCIRCTAYDQPCSEEGDDDSIVDEAVPEDSTNAPGPSGSGNPADASSSSSASSGNVYDDDGNIVVDTADWW